MLCRKNKKWSLSVNNDRVAIHEVITFCNFKHITLRKQKQYKGGNKMKGFELQIKDDEKRLTMRNTEKSNFITITAEDSENHIKLQMSYEKFMEFAKAVNSGAEKIESLYEEKPCEVIFIETEEEE